MKLPDSFIEDLIEHNFGKDVVALVNLLKYKEETSEFKLAEKLETSVNHVRNMLYRLDELNLVESTRQKDKEKGWYIYYWTLNMEKIKNLILTQNERKILMLTKRLEKEKTEDFYSCPSKCVRFDLSHAMDYDFRCTECGKLLERQENKKEIVYIEREIERLKAEMTEIKTLEDQEKEKIAKKLEREKKKKQEEKKATVKKPAVKKTPQVKATPKKKVVPVKKEEIKKSERPKPEKKKEIKKVSSVKKSLAKKIKNSKSSSKPLKTKKLPRSKIMLS